jgi:hypothetical protein
MATDTSRQARHALILRITQMGDVPPCRTMACRLTELGFPIGFVQVSKDYRALGLQTNRTKSRLEPYTLG